MAVKRSKIEKLVVKAKKNDVTYWEKAKRMNSSPSKMRILSFVNGPRGGDNYENDTFRLKILHEQHEK